MGSPKVIRWKLAIMEFNFDNEHIDGKKNVVADYFSRVKPEEPEILAMWYQPHNTAENRLQLIEKCTHGFGLQLMSWVKLCCHMTGNISCK